jgi:hypothetical protein
MLDFAGSIVYQVTAAQADAGQQQGAGNLSQPVACLQPDPCVDERQDFAAGCCN